MKLAFGFIECLVAPGHGRKALDGLEASERQLSGLGIYLLPHRKGRQYP